MAAQCKSQKICGGVVDFDITYLNIGADNKHHFPNLRDWTNAADGHGDTGPGKEDRLPTGFYEFLKTMPSVRMGANKICQADCAGL